MSLTYSETLYSNQAPCKCGAHSQHKIWRFIWNNRGAKQKEIARVLKMTLPSVKMAMLRLRKRHLDRLCPECFTESLRNGVCENCGFEPFEPVLPLEVKPDSQNPTNAIHAGNLLGSETEYQATAHARTGPSNRRIRPRLRTRSRGLPWRCTLSPLPSPLTRRRWTAPRPGALG